MFLLIIKIYFYHKKCTFKNFRMNSDKEVEYIVDKRISSGKGNKNEYLVRWVGYDDSNNQWVNEQDLTCNELIEEFNTPRCEHIKQILTAYKNQQNQIFYTVVLANGLLENYPSSFLKRKYPTMLQNYLEKCYCYDKIHRNDIQKSPPPQIELSDLIAF